MKAFYIQPEPDSQIYKKDAQGATLEKLAGIEIKVNDLVELYAERPPQKL